MDNCQIFISYRRAGGEHLAGRIADRLKAKGYHLFLDVDSLKAGKFNEQIYRAIETCNDVLVVLSPNALDRCTDEEDFVRKEVEYAISLNKNVIPILVKGFTFPDVLPPKMNDIRYREGVNDNSDYFDAMIDRIENLLLSKSGVELPKVSEFTKFLTLGLYPQALAQCEKSIATDPMNSDAYFYACVAMLAGKRPFLQDRATMRKMEEYLSVAITVGDKAIYHYFLAYLKLDYYYRKMLNTVPDYTTELQKSRLLGIKQEEVDELFRQLRTSKPAEL